VPARKCKALSSNSQDHPPKKRKEGRKGGRKEKGKGKNHLGKENNCYDSNPVLPNKNI
jgi:hypothetical protein